MLNLLSLKKLKNLNLKNPIIWIFGLFLVILTIGELHFLYPDEFENILGGYYILQGRLPYIGFFVHHNPFAYFFSAPILLVAGQSFVKFRLILGVVYSLGAVAFYIWGSKRFGIKVGKIILVWLVFLAIGATYWWGQMLLADSLASYLVSVPVILLFGIIFKNETIGKKDLWVISIFSSLALLTTFTLLYLVLSIYLFTLLWIIKNSTKKILSKENFKVIGVLSVPYLFFVLYLLITGSLKEYFYQSVIFNANYYAFLPGGVSVKNPMRVIVVLFYQFFINFKTMLVMTKDLNFGSPFAQTLVLSNAVMVLYSVVNRKFFLGAFVWCTLTLSIVRSNPYTTAETDYQGMTYHLISIFFGLVVLRYLWQELQERLAPVKQALYLASFMFLGTYFVFFSLYLVDKYLDKAYQKYMGTQALIYDRPSVASTLNGLLDKNDRYFLGPFDFENHLYMDAKLASRYIVVIPAMNKSDQIKNELISDLQKNKPKIVVFDTEMRVFGDKPGEFVRDFLSQNYFNLEHLGAPCVEFKATNKWFGSYDFERHFFFRNEDQAEIVKRLFNQKLIEPVDPNNVPAVCHERFKEADLKKSEKSPS